MSDLNSKELLQSWRSGDTGARDQLFTLLYSELRQISAALLRAESNNSLSTGDLVNEATLRLIRLDQIDWVDKSHFLALSARAMRRVLIDHARKKKSDKRQHHKVTLVTRLEGVEQRLDIDQLEKALIRRGHRCRESQYCRTQVFWRNEPARSFGGNGTFGIHRKTSLAHRESMAFGCGSRELVSTKIALALRIDLDATTHPHFRHKYTGREPRCRISLLLVAHQKQLPYPN